MRALGSMGEITLSRLSSRKAYTTDNIRPKLSSSNSIRIKKSMDIDKERHIDDSILFGDDRIRIYRSHPFKDNYTKDCLERILDAGHGVQRGGGGLEFYIQDQNEQCHRPNFLGECLLMLANYHVL